MDTTQREVFGTLVRAAYDAGPESSNYQAAIKVKEFLTDVAKDNAGSQVETTMMAVAGIAQLLKAVTDSSDMFGIGVGDLTAFERLAESLLVGAALYGVDIVPVPDVLPDLEEFKRDLESKTSPTDE